MNLFSRNPTGLFASMSLTGHLLRGAAGIFLLYWAIRHQSETGLSLTAALGALVAFRGCPVCWTVGLIETVLNKVKPLRRKFR